MNITIFQGKGPALTKDGAAFEVDEFTIEAVIAGMQKRRWSVPDEGAVILALRNDFKTVGWDVALVFTVHKSALTARPIAVAASGG